MRSILTTASIALSAVAMVWPVHADVSGRAQAIAGDSLRIGGARVGPFGIEHAQNCHADGKLWLCSGLAKWRLKGRVNAWMVSEGWAIAYRRHSRAHVDEEASAKTAKLGVWRGEFVPPWDWRRGKRLKATTQDPNRARETNRTAPRAASKATGCRIKGNISSKGTRIYHVPGGRYYERTRIDTSKGERWFCSEAEARKAGWRRARR